MPSRGKQFDPDNPQPYFTKAGVGKLFPDPKPEASHRWPRGYTPERFQEVHRDLPNVRGPVPTPEVSEKIRNEMRESAQQEGKFAGIDSSPTARRHGEGLERQTAEMIARSTVPTEALRGLGTIEWERGSAAAGSYSAPSRTNRNPMITVAANPEGPAVRKGFERPLIHEIGHHVSATQGNPHAATSARRTPEQRGTEEAFADVYADTHARPYRGQELSESAYPDRQRYYPEGTLEADQFTGAYHSQRPTTRPSPPTRKNPTIPMLGASIETMRDPDTAKWRRI